ncbi:MAG: ATP-dependent DNA helicase RecG [Candidatus Omnitrophota bacterium]
MKDLSVSAQFIKGVGPLRIKLLRRLGIETVENLLYFLPRRYEDRSNIKSIKDLTPGSFETMKVKVLTFGDRTSKKGMNIFKLALGDATGVIHAVWFNQPFMKDKFKAGDELIIYGKVEKNIYLQVNNPEYEVISGTKDDSIHIGRIVPIYPLTENLNQHWIRSILHNAVTNHVNDIKEMLPYEIRQKNNLILLKEAVRNIHFPVSEVVLEKAKYRLIFDEFLLLQLGITLKKARVKLDLDGISHNKEGDMLDRFRKSLPFIYTNSQERVSGEIRDDMKSPKPMNRLLQGDVGSGKTIVAIESLVRTVQNGFQGAIMVPTEILAYQHYKNIKSLLKDFDIDVVLLSGDLKQSEARRRKHMIEVGEADIVVGTHSLIQEGVRFKKLSLIVIDEQHKFGVMQRAFLKSKSNNPDILVMTATPIPRSLALTIYGDLDISVIDELPPGRREIKTLYFEGKNRTKSYDIAEEQVKIGRQVYIVYPVIEEKSSSDLRAAKKMYKELSDNFKDLKVGLIHGKMKSSEKESIMKDFKEKNIDILVSTVVVEVGLDIPNATVMIIEHAERFGLSQLHQLRGRIGRDKYISYCILIGNPKTDEARKRLEAMLSTQDGFKIAEYDLDIRGPGEFFGTRQHGLPEIKIGNIIRDRLILEDARKEAIGLIQKDRFLRMGQNRLLKESLEKKFGVDNLELVNVG